MCSIIKMSSILDSYFPPTRAQWELLVWGFSVLPYATIVLYFRPLILMGKHSITSRLNINGRFGWFIMEAPGFITLWTVLLGVKQQLGIETLPWMNYLMATLYVSLVSVFAKSLTWYRLSTTYTVLFYHQSFSHRALVPYISLLLSRLWHSTSSMVQVLVGG